MFEKKWQFDGESWSLYYEAANYYQTPQQLYQAMIAETEQERRSREYIEKILLKGLGGHSKPVTAKLLDQHPEGPLGRDVALQGADVAKAGKVMDL